MSFIWKFGWVRDLFNIRRDRQSITLRFAPFRCRRSGRTWLERTY